LFWVAQRAGQEAAATISSAIDSDPDTQVKRKAVFALSQLPEDQGVPLLIQVARTHANREVRKQAMFWLGQSNDPRALSFFEDVLRRSRRDASDTAARPRIAIGTDTSDASRTPSATAGRIVSSMRR
jgi:HEAT repeat protein